MLCGSGVAFKIVQALLTKLEKNGGQEKWLLDMVGIATLSDMVPLDGENRVLAHYGMKVLRKTRRPGLLKLLQKMKINPRYLAEDDIGFMISPRINAASRMGVPMDAYHLLSTKDEVEAGQYADHLDSINNERKGLVASTVKELKKILAERKDHYASQPVIVIGNPKWRPALLGLAANSLVEEHGKPVFLWGREEGKDIKGSCRSNGAVDLVKLMEAARHAFLEFGGHTMSGGFSVHHEKIHHLEDELVKAYESAKNEAHIPEESILIDTKLSIDDINPRTFELIDKLSPFGKGNEKPLFLFENLRPEEVKIFGKTQEHLELSFKNSQGRLIKAIGFFMKPEDFSVTPKKAFPIDLVATLEKSYFMNRPELRLRIVDII
jgi:single-stranded-DNA-specific exonuclease